MDIEQIKQEAIRLAEVEGNRSAFVYELDDEVYPFTHYTELYAENYLPVGSKIIWVGRINNAYDRVAKQHVRIIEWNQK